MAVDPVTAKILAQLATQAATDKQARKRLFIVILSPVLFLIAFIVHLLTSPISMFVEWALGDGEVAAIESFQREYGYNQNIGIYDADYVNGSGQSYEGIIFTDGGMEVMYYNQLDERWADVMYGTSSTIGQGGCGPTSMAIVVSTLTGDAHDPVELAQWSVANGHRCEGNGSYHSLIPAAAAAYGLSCEKNLDAQGIVDALSSGKLVVVIMSKGHFTQGGHFIVLRGVTSEGKILVADPASYGRSGQEWDLSIIMNESNKAAGSGGPYWAIGR
ncbi:C39 family peptidase [uncultured Acetatifactor sp.]|jgi:hypothetical protein|uniref:C39 family peptidase n=1 Tax=uncultured Acetatifactor sp. TaxID=1671927 RepID=UPI00261634F8|nr:C39 family peptidase [uncultured Acetatifactor sp.]